MLLHSSYCAYESLCIVSCTQDMHRHAGLIWHRADSNDNRWSVQALPTAATLLTLLLCQPYMHAWDFITGCICQWHMHEMCTCTYHNLDCGAFWQALEQGVQDVNAACHYCELSMATDVGDSVWTQSIIQGYTCHGVGRTSSIHQNPTCGEDTRSAPAVGVCNEKQYGSGLCLTCVTASIVVLVT